MTEFKDAYKRRYKMRALGENGLNIVVSIPRVVIEREAERQELTIEEFLEQFKAVAQYDNFDGVMYTFEKVTEQKRLSQINKGRADSGK